MSKPSGPILLMLLQEYRCKTISSKTIFRLFKILVPTRFFTIILEPVRNACSQQAPKQILKLLPPTDVLTTLLKINTWPLLPSGETDRPASDQTTATVTSHPVQSPGVSVMKIS